MILNLLAAVMLAALMASASHAQPSATARNDQASTGTDAGLRIAQLTSDVERAEAIRAVKRLQRSYAHYQELGLWDEIAALFVDDADARFGDDVLHGRDAIRRYLLETIGGGRAGLPAGALYTQMILTPVVTIAGDGMSAKGRWHEVAMLGRYGEHASWAGGVQENEYLKEQGIWKIRRLRSYPHFAGPYETGWRNVTDDLEIVPYHYTPAQAGAPVREAPHERSLSVPGPDEAGGLLLALERRIAAMNDEDEVRNLQNAYGYYMDRRMWDDVTDLFAADGTLDIAGLGVYVGAAGIRRALEREGSAGLRHGQLYDQLQMNAIVTVAADSARARGLQLSMVGENWGEAYWTTAIFENQYIKLDGRWRIRAMRVFPRMKSDYYQGWGTSAITDPPPAPEFAPDRPARAAGTERAGRPVPAFHYPHPVSGRPARYPRRMPIASVSDSVEPRANTETQATPSDVDDQRLAEARRKLVSAIAYDAIENVSSAFGNYIDDFQWELMAELFAENGAREMPSVGGYVSRHRILQAAIIRNGPPRSPRTSIPIHMRVQPVIHVAVDARSAKIRTRLFQINSSFDRPGSFTGGMYQDEAALEDGVWKLGSVHIDHIWRSPGYRQGWARVDEDYGVRELPALLTILPPDRPLRGLTFAPFPAIGPLRFHYRNPVSGRTPPEFWPD